MHTQKLFRQLICVIVVCCMIISVSPLQAKAVEPLSMALIGIPLILGVGALVTALGIAPESSTEVFDNFVSTISNGLDSAFTFVQDGITYLRLGSINSTAGDYMYAQQALVEAVLGQMVSEGTVALANATPLYHSANTILGDTNYFMCSAETFSFVRSLSKTVVQYLIVSADPNAVFYIWNRWKDPNNEYNPASEVESSAITVDGITYSYYLHSTFLTNEDSSIFYDGAFTEEVISALISTHTGLKVGELAENLSDDVYSGWNDSNIQTEADEVYSPLNIPASTAGLGTLGQTGVQAGGVSAVNRDSIIYIGDSVAVRPGIGVLPDVNVGEDTEVTEPTEIPVVPPAFEDTVSGLEGIFSSIAAWFASWQTWATSVDANINSILDSVADWFIETGQKWDALAVQIDAIITTWLAGILSEIAALGAKWNDLAVTLDGALTRALEPVIEVIISIPQSIAEAIATVLADVFVPSAVFVDAKVEALRVNFPWVDSIFITIDAMKAGLSSGSSGVAPVIYVHLQNAEGTIPWGGTVKFLDLSWYSRYKGTGDAILSGFLWACFLWRVFMKLPGIIRGDVGQAAFVLASSKENEK